jgi:hypothetical protein
MLAGKVRRVVDAALPFGPGITPGALHLNGIPVYSTPHLEPNYTAIELPPISRNRSMRVFKKLMQRVREAAIPLWTGVLMITDPLTRRQYIACHPTVLEKLRQEVAV